jgi:hypothetical protein
MSLSEYLRHQADTCLRIARAGFDLATAERLRHMAADLRAKADELDDARENGELSLHLMNGNGRSGTSGDFERG